MIALSPVVWAALGAVCLALSASAHARSRRPAKIALAVAAVVFFAVAIYASSFAGRLAP